jgi:ribosomal protein S18 acetylase RimI-like enzyme
MSAMHLRPEQADDEAFSRRVYAGTREPELARTGWDAATREAFLRMQFDAQRLHYRKYNPGADFLVVERDGVPVGRLYVDRAPGQIHVIDIAILPEFCGRGLGSELLGNLLREAERDGGAVSINVELDNRAYTLYQRLGFQEISIAGFHRLMEWRATVPA